MEHWQEQLKLSRSTIAQYLSAAKMHHTDIMPLEGHPVSPVWQAKGNIHPLFSQRLNCIPLQPKQQHQVIDRDWLRTGFLHTWTTAERFAILFMYNWGLRIGEVVQSTEILHLLHWDMVKFWVIPSDNSGRMVRLPMDELHTRPCDMVELCPRSRKWQPTAREMPGRMNRAKIPSPPEGLYEWHDLCAATLLQGWACHNHIDKLSEKQRQDRPVLCIPGENKMLTSSAISQALRRHQKKCPERTGKLTPHTLRHANITVLVNSEEVATKDSTLLAATGHANITSTKPYAHPNQGMTNSVTTAFETQEIIHKSGRHDKKPNKQ